MELLKDEKIESLLIDDFKIIQSDSLYKFTSDAILLSRFASAGKKRVLDLCAGSGIVGLHYYALNRADKVTEVEIQKPLYDMCAKSVALNGLEGVFDVVNLNLKDFNGRGGYDLVLCNPPYKKAGSGLFSQNPHIALCRGEVECVFEDIVACAARSLCYGGIFTFCHKPERLSEILILLDKYNLNPSRMTFVTGKGNTDVYLVLIAAVKDKNLGLKIDFIENNATSFSG